MIEWWFPFVLSTYQMVVLWIVRGYVNLFDLMHIKFNIATSLYFSVENLCLLRFSRNTSLGRELSVEWGGNSAMIIIKAPTPYMIQAICSARGNSVMTRDVLVP